MHPLSYRIRKAREFNGITQSGLSDLTGISLRSIKAYEKDASKIPYLKVQNIALACDVSESWLLTGKGVPNNNKKAKQHTNIINYNSPTEDVDYLDYLKNFKNKEKALQAVKNLLKIEQISEDAFLKIYDYIEAFLSASQIVANEYSKKSTTTKIDREKNKKGA